MTSDSRTPDIIAFRNGDNTVSLMGVGYKEDAKPGTHVLVFEKFGTEHFLREIRCSACSMSEKFNESRREKVARTHEASNGSVSTVYLALK